MKLRYYLRGLGIGMVVTALIMGVALKGDGSLSDAEIRVRAMELGMVDGDSRTLADNQPSQEQSVPPSAASPTGTPENTAAPTDAPVDASDPVDTPEDTSAPAGIPEGASDPAGTPDPATIPAETTDPEESLTSKPLPMVTLKPSEEDLSASDPVSDESVPGEAPETTTFVIRSGQSSYGVSKELAEAGLVEDALVFDQYLVANGYSKSINPGTYEIPLDSTQEEIAKIITRSR